LEKEQLNLKSHILITGSGGLIGSAAVEHFCSKGEAVVGVDNDMRSIFFGNEASNQTTIDYLIEKYKNYVHIPLDINNEDKMTDIFQEFNFKNILHTAAQPSHDKAAEIPLVDFEVNAVATLKLLNIYKNFAPGASFVFMSTNKVYGDAPNLLEMNESEKRFDFADPRFFNGINENFPIDNSMHSLFGVSKLSADLMVQEYGKYFDLGTTVLRGGCLTGPLHAGAKQHGFLSYLVKSLMKSGSYQIIGYKGKQVRDQIHSSDVSQIVELFFNNPTKGEVFNIGGGRENSLSILEILNYLKESHGLTFQLSYEETARKGDHICYYTDLSKLQRRFASFKIKYPVYSIIDEIVEFEKNLSNFQD
jgi:CDP-paratose 2-epimerase